MDLAAVLINAIEANRDRINAAAEPFVGRITFRVDLDCNLVVGHVTATLQPTPEQITLSR